MSTETDALDRVLALAVAVQADMTADLERRGLTPARAHVVWLLGAGAPCTQRALADAIGVSPRNVTGLVDGLEASGFVTREPHPGDRRASLVTLTARGRQTAEGLRGEQGELAGQLFGDVEPARLLRLVEDLDRLLARFTALAAAQRAREA